MEDFLKRLEDGLEELRRDEPLARHTSVQVGGPARAMALPRDARELGFLLGEVARETQAGRLPALCLIGGGANCFADSAGFDGLAIGTRAWRDPYLLEDSGMLVLGAGADLQESARAAAQAGWGGIDFMAEVPGSLGGAVAINAGTNVGGYVADRLAWVEALDWNGEPRRYLPHEMQFGYRSSRLLYGREIVTRAAFQLEPCDDPQALLAHFDAVMAERHRKFPYEYPNFGSTFRSPGRPWPPAGKLIDDLGLKGRSTGRAQISPRHGNFIVNRGGALSGDILSLMGLIYAHVHRAHGIRLRPEVHYITTPGRPLPPCYRDFAASDNPTQTGAKPS